MHRLIYILLSLIVVGCASTSTFNEDQSNISNISNISDIITGQWRIEETPKSLQGNRSAAQLWSNYKLHKDGSLEMSSCGSHFGCFISRGSWNLEGLILHMSFKEADGFKEMPETKKYKLQAYKSSWFSALNNSGDKIIFKAE